MSSTVNTMRSLGRGTWKVILGAVLVFAAAGSTPAATITPTAGSLTLTLIAPAGSGTPIALDLDGAVAADVFDIVPIGSFLLTDAEGIGGVDPFPNSFLLGVDFGVTEGVLFTFDGGSIAGYPGGLLINATTTAVGALTDPALLSIAAAGLFTFDFDFLAVQEDVVLGNAAFDLYSYEFLAARSSSTPSVPEPTSMLLLGGGLLAAALLRRRSA